MADSEPEKEANQAESFDGGTYAAETDFVHLDSLGSLGLGVTGILFFWLPFFGTGASLLALILGLLGVRRTDRGSAGSRIAVTGIVLGILGLLLLAIILVFAKY